MDPTFAGRRGYTYRSILYSAAVATHSVAFEVGEHHKVIIVEEVLANIIFLKVAAALNRQSYFAFSVHNIDWSHIGKTVAFDHFLVGSCISAVSTVSGIAFYNSAMEAFDKIAD